MALYAELYLYGGECGISLFISSEKGDLNIFLSVPLKQNSRGFITQQKQKLTQNVFVNI